MKSTESFFVSEISDRFDVVVRGRETSENPAYWRPELFFTALGPIDAFAIDTLCCKDTGHYYFSTQHIQYERGGRTVLGYTMKLVDLSYALALREKQSDSESTRGSGRHDGPINKVVEILRERLLEEWLKTFLLNDLDEIKKTMRVGAFRSAIGCCGRVLEGVLKTIFLVNQLKFDDSWPVGKLFTALEDTGMYLDPASKNMANLINSHRIVAVHCKRESKVPIPSENDAAGIMYLTLGLIERCLVDRVPGLDSSPAI
jgi:hypothetical protein